MNYAKNATTLVNRFAFARDLYGRISSRLQVRKASRVIGALQRQEQATSPSPAHRNGSCIWQENCPPRV
jgi:hypothetical protein